MHDVYLDNGTMFWALSTNDLAEFEAAAKAQGWRYDGPYVGPGPNWPTPGEPGWPAPVRFR